MDLGFQNSDIYFGTQVILLAQEYLITCGTIFSRYSYKRYRTTIRATRNPWEIKQNEEVKKSRLVLPRRGNSTELLFFLW